jgi:hypothetical protein
LYDPYGYMFLANCVNKYHLHIRKRIDLICRLEIYLHDLKALGLEIPRCSHYLELEMLMSMYSQANCYLFFNKDVLVY